MGKQKICKITSEKSLGGYYQAQLHGCVTYAVTAPPSSKEFCSSFTTMLAPNLSL